MTLFIVAKYHCAFNELDLGFELWTRAYLYLYLSIIVIQVWIMWLDSSEGGTVSDR